MASPRDQLGFLLDRRCPHCGAALYLAPEDAARGLRPICLNACTLPAYLERRMQAGIRAAAARIDAETRAAPDGD